MKVWIEMEAKGIEFLGETGSVDVYMWTHFRALDGNVNEITSVPS